MLVEQNPKLVFDIADDIVILNTGQVAVASTAAELNRDGVDLRQHLGVRFCITAYRRDTHGYPLADDDRQ